jgi:hypothetical protein
MKSKVLTFVAMLTCLNPRLPGQTSPNPYYQSMVDISTDGNGAIFGLNKNGQIFAWNGFKWTKVEGLLKQISVGSKTDIWGVNAYNEVWQVTTAGWKLQPGRMTHVAVAKGGGAVVAIDAQGTPYQWDGINKWNRMPNAPTALTKIEIGRPGNIWGLGKFGEIYQWMPSWNGWRTANANGALKNISVGIDGTIGGVDLSGKAVRLTETGSTKTMGGVSSSQYIVIDAETGLYINSQNLLVQQANIGLSEQVIDVSQNPPMYETGLTVDIGQGSTSPMICATGNRAIYTGDPTLCFAKLQSFTQNKSCPQVGTADANAQPLPHAYIIPLLNVNSNGTSNQHCGGSKTRNGPIVCQAKEFRNVSHHSWVEFRLPGGAENEQIWIAGGAYNKYVFPACNRVWWDDLTFTCNASTGWRLTQGRYDADGWCHGTPGNDKHVVVGDR